MSRLRLLVIAGILAYVVLAFAALDIRQVLHPVASRGAGSPP